jgi:hypothetical protein
VLVRKRCWANRWSSRFEKRSNICWPRNEKSVLCFSPLRDRWMYSGEGGEHKVSESAAQVTGAIFGTKGKKNYWRGISSHILVCCPLS